MYLNSIVLIINGSELFEYFALALCIMFETVLVYTLY